MAMRTHARQTLRGRVDRVYVRSVSEYEPHAICRFVDELGSAHVVAGPFVDEDLAAPALALQGRFCPHKRFGRVFRADLVWRGRVGPWEEPPPREGIVAFLAGGGLKGAGIGPAGARKLEAALGDRLWEALAFDAGLLAAHVGGMARAEQIQEAIRRRGISEVNALCRLMALNLSLARARRILDTFGVAAVGILRNNPYRMAEVPGIGFATADRIAVERMGLRPDDPRRLLALARAVLADAARQGSTSLPRDEALRGIAVLARKCGLEHVDPGTVLKGAIEAGALVEDLGNVYLPGLHRLECRAADAVARLALMPRREIPESVLDGPEFAHLTPRQKEALLCSLASPVALYVGSPGSGKTTVSAALCLAAERIGLSVTLTATTGKAADRMRQMMTGLDGERRPRTLHSALARGGVAGSAAPRILFCDEAGMLDLPMLVRAAEAVVEANGTASLVLCGDPDQLPSVLVGDVLRDLLDCGVVPAVELDRVFRYDKNSLIAIAVERARRGRMPLFHNSKIGPDLLAEINGYFGGEPFTEDEIRRNAYFLYAERPEDGIDLVVRSVRRWASRGWNPLRDVLVITPVRDGRLGTRNLNRTLQDALNPFGAPVLRYTRGKLLSVKDAEGHELRIGDPVFQTRNDDAGRQVVNGMRGIIVDAGDDEVIVDFPDRGVVRYSASQASELLLAYASTVHKAQGDQAPVVVFVAHHAEHYIVLNRSLLTVGFSRAQEELVVVGTPAALRIGLRSVPARHTNLAARIRRRYEELKPSLPHETPLLQSFSDIAVPARVAAGADVTVAPRAQPGRKAMIT